MTESMIIIVKAMQRQRQIIKSLQLEQTIRSKCNISTSLFDENQMIKTLRKPLIVLKALKKDPDSETAR